MANWRQVQGRIRRAKSGDDPVGKLTELFEKTHDAMVAFEAGALEEKSGRHEEAVRWYSAAAERFRRAEWKRKAGEALVRLGAPVPESLPEPTVAHGKEAGGRGETPFAKNGEARAPAPLEAADLASSEPAEVQGKENDSSAPAPAAKEGKRRRGRRGGRRHRRSGVALPAPPAIHSASASAEAPAPSAPRSAPFPQRAAEPAFTAPEAEAAPSPLERFSYGRAGEPALASRLAHLESMLRRLIASSLHRVENAEDAPAGPGVFLLSDSDLTTNYYIEACKTLRVGVGFLVRSGRASRGAHGESGKSLRGRLAEHLGISDAKVTDYLRKHCVVRWLQLDDEAPHLAHFAIAVLRPALNSE